MQGKRESKKKCQHKKELRISPPNSKKILECPDCKKTFDWHEADKWFLKKKHRNYS